MRLVIVQGGRVRLQTRNWRAASRDKRDLIRQADGTLGDGIQLLTNLDVLPEARLRTPRPLGQDSRLDLLNLSCCPLVWELWPGSHPLRPLPRRRAPLEVDDLPADGGDDFLSLVEIGIGEAIGHRSAGEGARRGSVKAVIHADGRNPVAPID